VKSIVFVFSTSTLPYPSTTCLLRPFTAGQTFAAAAPIVPSGGHVTLTPGVYVAFSDSDSERPPLLGTGPTVAPTATHVVVEYMNKDKWPDPPSAGVIPLGAPSITQSQMSGIVGAVLSHLSVDPSELDAFLAGRGSGLPSGLAALTDTALRAELS
jgi:hypothetical protein